MTKPDIIIYWPRNTDYPLWRQMIRDNRDRFNEVIIIFTETYQGSDYRDFVRQSMFQDHVLFVESPLPRNGEDWRNIAVNFGLMHSLHSEWVWFTEQDFFPKEGFWEWVEQASQSNPDVIGAFDGDRLHPCSIFIKREVLNKVQRQFGIVVDKLDHFGVLQNDLRENGSVMISIPEDLYKHMAGLSHNMRLVTEGQTPNHAKQDFDQYVNMCMEVSVGLHDEFVKLCTKYTQAFA